MRETMPSIATRSTSRRTNETTVSVAVNLDGAGKARSRHRASASLDHMLDQISPAIRLG